jgi:Tfp pilus assembly protein PilN
MIPRAWHQRVRIERELRRFALGMGVVLLAGAGAGAALRWRIAHAEPELARLRIETNHALALQSGIEQTRKRTALLEQALGAFATLRGGGEALRMADAIEAALGAGVRFEQLSFVREIAPLAAGAAPLARASDLTLAAAPAAAGAAPAAPESWRLTRRIDIGGAAHDYAALSAFLNALSSQQRLGDVRLVRSAASAAGAQQIDFTLNATPGPPP